MKKEFSIFLGLSCALLHIAVSSSGASGIAARSDDQTEISSDITTAISSSNLPGTCFPFSMSRNQNPSIIVVNGGEADDLAYSVQQTSDGGYVVAGYTESYGAGGADVLLLKYDAAGAVIWAKVAGGENDDVAYSVQQTTDGGFVVAGYTESYGVGKTDMLLLKYDATGSLAWARTKGKVTSSYGFYRSTAISVEQTQDGGYIILGDRSYVSYYDPYAGSSDLLLLKFSASGELTWLNIVGDGGDSLFGKSVQQTPDSGYLVAGRKYHYKFSECSIQIFKYDSEGNMLWRESPAVTYNDFVHSIRVTADGGFVVVASSSGQLLLLKYDAAGALSWARTTSGDDGHHVYSIQQTSDGGYIAAGKCINSCDYTSDILLLKFDDSGAVMAAWRVNAGIRDDAAFSVGLTTDGGYVVAGYTKSCGAGGADFFLAKVNADGIDQYCSRIVACNVETAAPVITTQNIQPGSVFSSDISILRPAVLTSEVTTSRTLLCDPTLLCDVELILNQYSFHSNDNFHLEAVITPYVSEIVGRFFVVLDLCGVAYYYYPSWNQELTYMQLNWPVEDLPSTILNFTFPQTDAGSGGLSFYSAVLDENFNLLSNLSHTGDFSYYQ